MGKGPITQSRSGIVIPGQTQIHTKTEGNVRIDKIPLDGAWFAIPEQINRLMEEGFNVEETGFDNGFCYLISYKSELEVSI